MKNTFIRHSIAMLLAYLLCGAISLEAITTPEKTTKQNTDLITCYVSASDLSTAKWNEIANPHGYTEYFIIDSYGSAHTISQSDYTGDWGDLMNCLGLSPTTPSIIIADDIEGM